MSVKGIITPTTVSWLSKSILLNFLTVNPQVDQNVKLSGPSSDREKAYLQRIKCAGYYRPGKLVVVTDICTKPGRGYSWPRHRSDRTEIGVLGHELGHHVHMSRPDYQEIVESFPRKGPRVSSYEPTVDESFAETFRLFLLNPDLLELGRPVRFKFLDSLGFKTIENRPWKEALGDCPRRIIVAAESWL